jgi:hypothetical protein
VIHSLKIHTKFWIEKNDGKFIYCYKRLLDTAGYTNEAVHAFSG